MTSGSNRTRCFLSSAYVFCCCCLLVALGAFADVATVERPIAREDHRSSQRHILEALEHHHDLESARKDATFHRTASTGRWTDSVAPRLLAEATGDFSNNAQGSGSNSQVLEVLWIPVVAVLLLPLLLSVTVFPPFEGLKPMVLLMLLGCGLSFCIIDKLDWQDDLDVLGRSYTTWVQNLDVAFLKLVAFPPLLVFDVLTFDAVFAQRGSLQWFYLALPGLVGSAALVGYILHLYLPYDWPFSLSLAFAATLGASETADVLTWLQDSRSSPLFQLQIQGEAFLSTGSSYSLFLLALAPVLGSDLEVEDVVFFICRNPICGLFFGLVVGVLVRFWMKVASRAFNLDSTLVRSVLVMAATYFSYAVAEGTLLISGPFAVVGVALALPNDAAIQSQWRVLKQVSQAFVLFLAGLKLGVILEQLETMDLLHLLVVALLTFVLRLLLVLALDFFMGMLHRNRQPISLAEALASCWTNFRGAATLLMAMQVSSYAGSANISQSDADHFLFLAAGMVFCTSGIQLCGLPALLRELGIGQPNAANFKIMHMVHSRMLQHLRAQASTVEVSVVRGLLDSAGHKLAIQAARTSVLEPDPAERMQGTGRTSTLRASFRDFIVVDDNQAPTKGDVQLLVHRASRRFQALSPHKKQQLQHLAAANRWLYKTEELLARVLPSPVLNDELLESLNRIFLVLLQKQYLAQLEAGVVPRRVGEILVMSALSALSEPCGALLDFRRICEVSWFNHDDGEPTAGALWDAEIASAIGEHLEPKSCSRKCANSCFFNFMVVVAIGVCAVWSFESPNTSREDAWLWEVTFSAIFTLEFFVRLFANGRSCSFASLLLTLEGLLTLAELAAPIIHAVWKDAGIDLDYPARPLFAARAIALLWKWPALTVHRLDTVFQKWSATRVTKTEVLLRVVEAHSLAQIDFEDLFGPQGPNSAEVHATLLLSQTTVFDALTICGDEDTELRTLTDQMQACRSNVAMMMELGKVLGKSVAEGVINPTVGDAFDKAMKHETRKVRDQLQELRSGMQAMTLPFGAGEGDESPAGEGDVAQQPGLDSDSEVRGRGGGGGGGGGGGAGGGEGRDGGGGGDGDSQMLGVLLGNSGPEVKGSTIGTVARGRIPVDMLSQNETEISRRSDLSSNANSRKPRASQRSRGSRKSSALMPEGPNVEVSSKAQLASQPEEAPQLKQLEHNNGSCNSNNNEDNEQPSSSAAVRRSSNSQARKSKRSSNRSSSMAKRSATADAPDNRNSNNSNNGPTTHGNQDSEPQPLPKKAGPRFSKMRTEDDDEEEGPKIVRKATSMPKTKKKVGHFGNIKRLFLDGGKAEEVNAIQWKFGRFGAWIRNIGHGAPMPPQDSEDVGPGDRLVSINGVDIRRSTKAEIEATWIEAQRNVGMLELEFESPTEDTPGNEAPVNAQAAPAASLPAQAAAGSRGDREVWSMLSSELSTDRTSEASN